MSSTIRKALWPAALATLFLVVFGAMSQANVSTVSAAPGDVCYIEGPDGINPDENLLLLDDPADVIMTDQPYDYIAYFESGAFDLGDILDLIGEEIREIDGINLETVVDVNVDDGTGDAAITSRDTDGDMVTEPINPTDHLNAQQANGGDNLCGPTDEEIIDDLAAEIFAFLMQGIEDGEICAEGVDIASGGTDGNDATDCQAASPGDLGPGEVVTPADPNHDSFNDEDIDCGYVGVNDTCAISSGATAFIAEAMAEAMFADGVEGFLCFNYGDVAEAAALAASQTEFVAFQFEDYVMDTCEIFPFDIGDDEFLAVDVTCEEAGLFDLSFAPELELQILINGGVTVQTYIGEPGSIEILCLGEADDATLTANPTTVEIVPAKGSVAHSLLVLTVVDEDGNPAAPGDEVDWSTDRCRVDALDEAEYLELRPLFAALVSFDPDTAAAIDDALDTHGAPDTSSNTFSFDPPGPADPITIAAAVLHCDNPNTATPGIATVEAQIDVTGADITAEVEVTVVGPVAFLTATASPTSVICGEKATITINATDAAQQDVSDHTVLELVTNYGGVLGGTGATLGFPGTGPVNPLSSTAAETFDGVAVAYLLTSANHVGDYEVVVAGGGSLSGAFSTPVVTAQVTVTCTLPAAPTVTAPTTGTGTITPPNTGDAGLVTASSSNSLLFVVAGAVAFVLAGLVSFRFARQS